MPRIIASCLVALAALAASLPGHAQLPPQSTVPAQEGWIETQLDSVLTSNGSVFNWPRVQWGAGRFTIVWPERFPDQRVGRLKYIQTAPTFPDIPKFTIMPDDRANFGNWLPLNYGTSSMLIARRSGPSYYGYYLQPLVPEPGSMTPIRPGNDPSDFMAAAAGPQSIWFALSEPNGLVDPLYTLTLYEVVPGEVKRYILGPEAVFPSVGVLEGTPYLGYLRRERTMPDNNVTDYFELARLSGNGLLPVYTSRRDPDRFNERDEKTSRLSTRPRLAVDPLRKLVWALFYDSVEGGLTLVRYNGEVAEAHVVVYSEQMILADIVAYGGDPYVYFLDRPSNSIVQLRFTPTQMIRDVVREYSPYRDQPAGNLDAEVSDGGQAVVLLDLVDPGGTYTRLVALSRNLAAAPVQTASIR